MRQILIAFSRPKKFKIGAKAIQLFDNTEYCHTLIVDYDTFLYRKVVVQASHGSVHNRSWELFRDENIVTDAFEVTCTEEQYRELKNFILDNLGKSYGFLQLIAIPLVRLGVSAKSPLIKWLLNGKDQFICSELVGMIDNLLHKELYYSGPQDVWTPKMVYDHCVKNHKRIENADSW